MCGICGFNWDDKQLLTSMTSILSHRGPDGSGYYNTSEISLGHRRLSIIDLSTAGKQPMANEEGSIWVTFNGEIYNFKELRILLEKKGHQFFSNTDTEVLVHGYEEWGEKILEKLNGMFAFAIWDSNNRELFLARDRLGIKPLYYYWNGNKFIFASEIKAILCDSEIPREVDKDAARDYLNLRYIPGEKTLFLGIKKLLPGYYAILKNNLLEIKQFWDVPMPRNKKDTLASKKIFGLFEDSIKKQLIADVPVGVYLSGGLDSASIVGLASQLKEEPIKTFSVGFNSTSKVDELHRARKIAEYFQTDHREIVIEGSIRDLMAKALWHLDMPHGDPVIIPQFKLSQEASKKVKVVLSGEGADEIFGGYIQYKKMLQARPLRIIPRLIRQNLVQNIPLKILDKVFDYPESIGSKGKEKIIDFMKDLNEEEKAYHHLVSITSNKDRKKMILLDSKVKYENTDKPINYFQKKRGPLLNRMLYFDTKTWLPNYVLQVNDRMTMANSIEGRVPFLDHRLIEYASTLHPALKINKGVNKVVFRQAMRQTLPPPMCEVKKHAFFMPLDNWYKNELRGLAEELFTVNSVRERGHFDYYHLRKIWENYNSSKLLYGKQLFTVINLELWQRMFIDGENIPHKPNTIDKLL